MEEFWCPIKALRQGRSDYNSILMKLVVCTDVNAVMGLHGCGGLQRHEDMITIIGRCGVGCGTGLARFDEGGNQCLYGTLLIKKSCQS